MTIIVVEDIKEYTRRCLRRLENETARVIVFCTSIEQYSDFREMEFHELGKQSIEELNSCIYQADEKWILLLKSSYVLACDFFSNLKLQEKCLYISNILHDTSEGLVNYEDDKAAIFGKIFSKDIFIDKKLKINGILLEQQLEIYLEILDSSKNIFKMSDRYIYTGEEKENWEISKEKSLYILETYPDIIKKYFDSSLFEHAEIAYADDVEKLQYLIKIIPNYKGSLKDIQLFMNKQIQPILYKIRTNGCSYNTYEELQKLFRELEEIDIMKIVFKLMGITPEELSAIKTLNFEDYQYYMSMYQREDIIKVTNEREERKESYDFESLYKKIEEKVNIIEQKQQIEEKSEKNINEIYGNELIEFTLNSYAQGKLGLQTIIKSVLKWLTYKLKQK